ncbi:COMPASS (complex proteins associated with Set1p) component [Teratosphaeriaceae sp. CCFEE 6253]|nr:COMPASS (complex proteins associated with Set1p) component [Teratosphaeriaceae sp. CCFEE 6253]
MSFSLFSLLNPAPAQTDNNIHRSPEQQRKSLLPPLSYVQLPEQQYASAPPPPSEHRQPSFPPATAQDPAQAFDAPPSAQYHNYDPSSHDHDGARPTSFDHRASSGHSAPIELPPPTRTTRPPSSPTLEQYHVASRSPEQRKQSMVSPPQQPGPTLPPLQGFAPASMAEQTRRPSATLTPAVSPEETQRAWAHVPPSGVEDLTTDAGHVPVATQSGPAATVSSERAVELAGGLDGTSPPPRVKQELATPAAVDARRPSMQYTETTGQTPRVITALKQEHSVTMQSPLRESSVPMPSTEMPAPDTAPSRKRPAPSKTKKGTATLSKKAPPSKKRKVDPKRSSTPASRASKVPTLGTSTNTPATSSPARSPTATSSRDSPAYASASDDAADASDREADGDVYCVCRKPDNGTFMIGCDGSCEDWFHGKCVEIAERDKNLIDRYLCPGCTKRGEGRTTWKRMCRRGGCRQPARIKGGKNGGGASKYCSEECGVLYFREMVAQTRGREEVVRSRGSRRKASLTSTDRVTGDGDDDLGAKGGALAAGEVKGLLVTAKSADDFQKLGAGVLSPPATPGGEEAEAKETAYTAVETAALGDIHTRKEVARRRHQLLKDRMRFVTLAKQAAGRVAAEREVKPKEYCGYNPRLEWTETQFSIWRESDAGRQAFELDTLGVESSRDGDKHHHHHDAATDGDTGDGVGGEEMHAQLAVCDRKKCARHLEWSKLAVDDVRFEMGDNSDRMRGLDREERGVREGAALRARRGAGGEGEGRVEMHTGLGRVSGDDNGNGNGMGGSGMGRVVDEGEAKAGAERNGERHGETNGEEQHAATAVMQASASEPAPETAMIEQPSAPAATMLAV